MDEKRNREFDKIIWDIFEGDLVQVRRYTDDGEQYYHKGIVVAEKGFDQILLFPYVGPVVALAYTWELLLDPNSGTLNSLLINFQIIENPINLLGQKYIAFHFFGFDLKLRLALTTGIFFEIWRYFPLAFFPMS